MIHVLFGCLKILFCKIDFFLSLYMDLENDFIHSFHKYGSSAIDQVVS